MNVNRHISFANLSRVLALTIRVGCLLSLRFVRFDVAMAQPSPDFFFAPNGVTVRCPRAPVNATGVLDGVEYTKRRREELLALVASEAWEELSTTCTSGIVSFKELFRDVEAFDADIRSWDVTSAESMEAMFRGASSFNQDLSSWAPMRVTSMKYMFRDTPFDADISGWDVSSVEDMSWMFYNADAFNQPIGDWDTSRVKDFSGMFYEATAFNQPIGNWNTSSATSLYAMFGGAKAFDQPIGGWDVRSVTNMADLFWNAAVFNQDINGWNTSAVTNMADMFRDAFAFNQPLNSWDTGSVTKSNSMFKAAYVFDQDIGDWDVSKNTRMDDMFSGATAFNQDLSRWNTSSVYNMASMFEDAESFNQDISSWDTSAVEDMSKMFSGASSFNQNLSGWKTMSVKTMAYMFDSATMFDGEIGGWDTSAVEDMSFMFQNAENFNKPLEGFDTSRVVKLTAMFQGAEAFNQDISGWNTAAVKDMSVMFQDAEAFDQDIGAWDTSSVKDMSVMFFGAKTFNHDIGDWVTSSVIDMSRMFSGAMSFDQDIGRWNTRSVKKMVDMFVGASAFNQDLSLWSVAGVEDCSNFAGSTASWGNPAGSPPLPNFIKCDPTPTSLSEPPIAPSTDAPSSQPISAGQLGTQPDDLTSSSSSSMGIIVGIVCGVVAIVLLSFLIWWRIRKRRLDASKYSDLGDESSHEKEFPGTAGGAPWPVPVNQALKRDDSLPFSPFGAVASATNDAPWVQEQGGVGSTAAPGAAALPGVAAAHAMKDLEQGHEVSNVPPTILIDQYCLDHCTSAECAGVSSPQRKDNGTIIHAKSPSMSFLSLGQPPLSAEVLDQSDMSKRGRSVARSLSWDGRMESSLDVDSLCAAEVIRQRRSLHIEKSTTISVLDLPALGDDFVPTIDMHVAVESIEKTLTKCIGTGGYGKVYMGEFMGEEVAVKKLPPAEDSEEQGKTSAYVALIKEIKLMSKFDSNRLVKILGACTDDHDKCCLIMELMRGGDLAKKIHDPRRRRLTYIQILQIAQDIAEGLAYLHPLVTHRDLKPGNILLDEHGRAKIGDFGISKVKQLDKTFLSDTIAFNGTIMYMAPEQLNGGKLDEKVDVYSLGCIINEMFTRQYPWPSDDPRMMFQILRMVGMEGRRPWVDPDTPDRLKRLIVSCWAQDPRDRPSCSEIVKITEILIREELKRLEERDGTSSCDTNTVRLSFGRWSSVEMSSTGTGGGTGFPRSYE